MWPSTDSQGFDLIYDVDRRSDGPGQIIPFRPCVYAKESLEFGVMNPSSTESIKVIQTCPVFLGLDPRLSSNYVSGPKLLEIFRIKSENDF
jgi:hypothetical protein